MDACATCPNRVHADTLDAVAEAAAGSRLFRVFAPALRRRAEEVRTSGCNNWKMIEYAVRDKASGQPLETKVHGACMRDHLPAWFNSVNALAAESCQTAQSHRNVVAEGFSYLAGRPIVGDQASLPKEFRGALREAGISAERVLPAGEDG